MDDWQALLNSSGCQLQPNNNQMDSGQPQDQQQVAGVDPAMHIQSNQEVKTEQDQHDDKLAALLAQDSHDNQETKTPGSSLQDQIAGLVGSNGLHDSLSTLTGLLGLATTQQQQQQQQAQPSSTNDAQNALSSLLGQQSNTDSLLSSLAGVGSSNDQTSSLLTPTLSTQDVFSLLAQALAASTQSQTQSNTLAATTNALAPASGTTLSPTPTANKRVLPVMVTHNAKKLTAYALWVNFDQMLSGQESRPSYLVCSDDQYRPVQPQQLVNTYQLGLMAGLTACNRHKQVKLGRSLGVFNGKCLPAGSTLDEVLEAFGAPQQLIKGGEGRQGSDELGSGSGKKRGRPKGSTTKAPGQKAYKQDALTSPSLTSSHSNSITSNTFNAMSAAIAAAAALGMQQQQQQQQQQQMAGSSNQAGGPHITPIPYPSSNQLPQLLSSLTNGTADNGQTVNGILSSLNGTSGNITV